MKRPIEIARQEMSMTTLVQLTGIFEGIASMRIAQIKNQVLQSTKFFNELWGIYSQLDVDQKFRFGRDQADKAKDKELLIIITAEGGFSGDIDQKLVRLMLRDYQPDKNDIIVIGRHGATQLSQQGVIYQKYFKMPSKDRNINVTPIVREVQQYRSTKLFYQEYISLMVQEEKYIDLSAAVKQRGDASRQADEVVNGRT